MFIFYEKKYIPQDWKIHFQTQKSYQIIKQFCVNGKMKKKYYGSFKDYNNLILYLDECFPNNWDIPKYENPMKHNF